MGGNCGAGTLPTLWGTAGAIPSGSLGSENTWTALTQNFAETSTSGGPYYDNNGLVYSGLYNYVVLLQWTGSYGGTWSDYSGITSVTLPAAPGASFSVTTGTTGAPGSLSGTNCATGSQPVNTPVTCIAAGTDGSTFVNWTATGSAASCNGSTSTTCGSFNLTADTTLSANFSGGSNTCADPYQMGPPTFLSYSYSAIFYAPPTILPIIVGFQSPTPGCAMNMTLDGSAPSTTIGGSTVAYSPQTISVSTTVRVIAFQEGYANSNIIGRGWTILTTQAPRNLNVLITQ
jgi:hypothetical protein